MELHVMKVCLVVQHKEVEREEVLLAAMKLLAIGGQFTETKGVVCVSDRKCFF
jgi:hypothetical protein